MAPDEAIDILKVLVPIAKAVPILGAPVEGSLEALSKILEFAQGVKSTKKKTEELAVQAARWLNTVFDVLKELELKANHTELEGLRPNMVELHKALIAIMMFTEDCAKQGAITQLRRMYKDEEELSKLSNALEAAFRRFQFDSHVRIEKALNAVLTTTDTILTSANTVLPTTHAILTSTNTILTTNHSALTATQTLLTVAETETLKDLKPVSSARWSSRDIPAGCLKGTREDVLCTMFSWLAEPLPSSSSISIFWLAGLAGTGKSTIIKTFCQRVSNDENFLLTSFFASRNFAERRDPYRILHTFAHQLAITSDHIRPHVLSAVRAPQDVMQEPMHEQIKQLLAEPIEKAQLLGRTIVFVIDALDECQKSAGVEGGPLIELLAQSLQHQPVKLIVASRQEDTLTNMFRTLGPVSLRLHEIGLAIVEADVRRVFNEGFADIRRKRALSLQNGQWPSQSQLDKLVHLTGPFFIYAATMLKFVGAPRFLPEQQLNQILERGSAISSDSSQPFLQIDKLYLNVLQSATVDDESGPSSALCRRVGHLLRTVVLLEKPVAIGTLAHLMGVSSKVQEVDNDIRALASVLLISPPSGSKTFSEAVSTFHPSFRDFLVDPQRCSDEDFLVKPAAHQHELLYQCLHIMNSKLCYDICGIRQLGLANTDIHNLLERLTSSVSEPLQYACQFWPVHMVASSSLAEPVSAALLEFCTKHLFHWLEVLSLCDDLSSAAKHLRRMIAWFQSHLTDSPSMQMISLLLKDAYRVLRAYADPIMSHALQVYQSVLATGPSCILLDHMQYDRNVAPRLVSPRASGWSSALQVMEGHTGPVYSVVYSLDGLYIASGSDDKTVRVWDAHTGKELAVLKGHSNEVQSVAFSPDGAHIASGSNDSTVRVWDAHTGKELAVLEGHSGSVWCATFSPDGAHIISGSDDKTVRVWDAHTGKELAVLAGHSRVVRSVAFSPDGAHIVSGSGDKGVRVWDAQTSKELAVLQGHSNAVWSVAFSPDGAHIISGSNDRTVRVWDAHKGKELAKLEGHSDAVWSVAFSPDGAHIMSASCDRTVRVWHAQTGKELAVLKGHSNWVKSVAFSPDGAHIVSGSDDRTVRVWDVQTGKGLAVLGGHSGFVLSVAFSPDGAHIVSGSYDRTVRVWDAHTGEELAVLKGHRNGVNSVAFSPDKTHIISTDFDGFDLAWNVTDLCGAEVMQSHTSPITHALHSRTEPLVWDEQTGWISWRISDGTRLLPLCWIPVERRGSSFASHGTTAVVGARQGIVTILDYSDIIAMLKHADQALFT